MDPDSLLQLYYDWYFTLWKLLAAGWTVELASCQALNLRYQEKDPDPDPQLQHLLKSWLKKRQRCNYMELKPGFLSCTVHRHLMGRLALVARFGLMNLIRIYAHVWNPVLRMVRLQVFPNFISCFFFSWILDESRLCEIHHLFEERFTR